MRKRIAHKLRAMANRLDPQPVLPCWWATVDSSSGTTGRVTITEYE